MAKKKSRKRLKIAHASWKYNNQWEEPVPSQWEQEVGQPPMSCRTAASTGFEDGAKWMLNEVLHHLRKNKYFADKLKRENPVSSNTTFFALMSAVYSSLIEELGEWKPE